MEFFFELFDSRFFVRDFMFLFLRFIHPILADIGLLIPMKSGLLMDSSLKMLIRYGVMCFSLLFNTPGYIICK